jgi:hypothetical protein
MGDFTGQTMTGRGQPHFEWADPYGTERFSR